MHVVHMYTTYCTVDMYVRRYYHLSYMLYMCTTDYMYYIVCYM